MARSSDEGAGEAATRSMRREGWAAALQMPMAAVLLASGGHRLGAVLRGLHALAVGRVRLGPARRRAVLVRRPRARRDVLAHLLDERLQLVDDLLEGLGGVLALRLLLLEEGVDRHEVGRDGRNQPRLVARA